VSEPERIPLGWSDQTVPLHSYIAFYYSDDSAISQSLAFLRVGLAEPGTFCAMLADASRHEHVQEQFQRTYEGDLAALIRAGKLALVGESPSFDDLADSMVSRIDRALEEGYVRVRALGFVAWGQPGWPDVSALKRCEAAVNRVAAAYPAVIVCAYNVPKLAGGVIVETPIEGPVIVVNEPEGRPGG
jgi:MEDS: MEthanogen/methylotroph, DcmR Sensory domain